MPETRLLTTCQKTEFLIKFLNDSAWFCVEELRSLVFRRKTLYLYRKRTRIRKILTNPENLPLIKPFKGFFKGALLKVALGLFIVFSAVYSNLQQLWGKGITGNCNDLGEMGPMESALTTTGPKSKLSYKPRQY